MFKKLVQLFIILAIISIVTIGFASPEEMSVDDNGNITGLIILNNPREGNTFEKEYVLSGSGKEGIMLTVYMYNSETNNYKKVYIVDEVGIKPAEWEIGASGIVMQEIQLEKGKNLISLRATLDDYNYQVIKIDVNLLSKDLLMRLKELNINLGDIYNKIFK